MATLSLAMIVKDEERTLYRILSAAKTFCDELIVVDTGSSDNTIAIAESLGAKVFHFPWIDDFAAARNHAFEQATCDWVCWYDADDELTDESQAAVRKMKSTMFEDPAIDAVFVPYHVLYNDKGEVTQKYDRERFFRRSVGCHWVGAVHENIITTLNRTARCMEATVDHRPAAENMARKVGRNLRIIEKTIDVHTAIPHDVFQYGCELQWNSRPADAEKVFGVYLDRERNRPDVMGEQYLAAIKRADCLNQAGRFGEAMACLRDAIGIDPTRAEAHCLAGRFCMLRNLWREAFPYMVAAASCQVPVNSPNIVFTWFYNDSPRRDLMTIVQHLEGREAVVEQLKMLAVATMTTLQAPAKSA
jgi:hypothetical protein